MLFICFQRNIGSMRATILTNCSFATLFSLWLLADTSCAFSSGRTLPLAACPALLWLMSCWDLTHCRLNLETMIRKSMTVTTSVTSSLPPLRRRSWKRRWQSCIKPTGLLTCLMEREWPWQIEIASLAGHLSIVYGMIQFFLLELHLVRTT